ncbi:beta-lactamase-like protein [Aspergillus pseudoustus]|uniref:Protein artemis n=1 Tax=Aspergillus pseudoustus TaxID=1810923 RepID=A0ABR4JMY9_9EURO
MSTFDGLVQEFPFISIDYFRKNPERPPPLACFLSHAHSDHLQGLESFRAPFIYCSAATRELLLQIEKYPHRMNFNNGILESRRLHYKHLSKLLRPIPLNTPTEIDLTPRLSIRVTLLDANHCTGAVMFLIEGDGKAILYTGDIRSESWWIDSLIRHPVLIPYTLGNKRLDKIYLDTTFANTSHAFHTFPTKAEGLTELLRKLEPYPEDTIFYFRAWTFGYEEVWMALSTALRSKIHVDRYQLGLYRSVASACKEGGGAAVAPSLCGYELGNRIVPGCLSEDLQCRIHSCEPGVHCQAVSSRPTVYITPIVNRTRSGTDIPELGAGGGLGDLYQISELELPDQTSLARLEQLCIEKIHDAQALSRAKEALSEAFKSRGKTLSLDSYGLKDAHEMPLDELVNVLSRGRSSEGSIVDESTQFKDGAAKHLPRTIRFPYSRHSSYTELCKLVAAFKPRDIYPCTVDPSEWDEDISMQRLFGHLCSDNLFVHDQYMLDITAAERGERSRKRTRRDPESSSLSTQQSTIITEEETDSRASQNLYPIIDQTHGAPTSWPANLAALEPPSSRPIIITSSLLSSYERTTIPATLEPTEDSQSLSNNDSMPIPPASPATARARRNAIRQAWHYLDAAQDPRNKQFDLGSLPSSWPNEEDRSQLDAMTAELLRTDETAVSHSSQETEIHDPDIIHGERAMASLTPTTTTTTNTIINPTSIKPRVMETDSNSGTDPKLTTNAPSPLPNPYPANSSQQSDTPTISTSAFASQSQNLPPNRLQDQDERIMDEEEYISAQEHPPFKGETEANGHPLPPPLVRKESSLRRREAYLAAREGSYDAWASVSLVSAGNNHTEEEVEL